MEDYRQYLAQKILTEDQVVSYTSNIPETFGHLTQC